jgi:hypothetical protein
MKSDGGKARGLRGAIGRLASFHPTQMANPK